MSRPSSEHDELLREAEREALPLRAQIGGLGKRGRTTPYPREVRASVVEYAGQWRARGLSWKRIGRYVGLSGWAVERWWRLATGEKLAEREAVALVEVRVKPDPVPVTASSERSSKALVSPGGYRVEGLELCEVVQLLRALP